MCSLDCERHTELVGLCQAQVACAELCQVAVPAGIHVQRVAPFCPLLLALPRTCCCKQAAGQAPAAAWCCRTMLALAWRSRRRRCSWHNCSCRSSLTRAHVRVCAGCKWRALIGYASWDPTGGGKKRNPDGQILVPCIIAFSVAQISGCRKISKLGCPCCQKPSACSVSEIHARSCPCCLKLLAVVCKKSPTQQLQQLSSVP